MNTLNKKKGFTLIEMTVSLGLFTIVMFIATSAFLSVVNADRKSRSVRIAADNLNIALEDMSRRIKTGSTYFCGTNDAGGTLDCTVGASNNTLFFMGQDGLRVKYTLDNTTHAIWRTVGLEQAIQATSPEISINNLDFVVAGSPNLTSGNKKQPTVTILIDGALGTGVASSTFKIQTTVTQRAYDNQ